MEQQRRVFFAELSPLAAFSSETRFASSSEPVRSQQTGSCFYAPDGLHLSADVHAAFALDALVGVANNDRSRIHRQIIMYLGKRQHINLVFSCQRLKLAEMCL